MGHIDLTPYLTVGYGILSTKDIESVAKGSTRAAAVSIADATASINSPTTAAVKSANKSTGPSSSIGRGTPSPSIHSNKSDSPTLTSSPTSSYSPANSITTLSSAPSDKPYQPTHNFLRVDFTPDPTGLHLNLLLQIEEICDFIDGYLNTFPDVRTADEEAAVGWEKSDDDTFCGNRVLAMTGEKSTIPVGVPGKIMMIQGGETKTTRCQPAFVGIAYLMRKWNRGFNETFQEVSWYNASQGGEKIRLTGNQQQQLVLWETTRYRIIERGTLGGRFYKSAFSTYRRSKSVGN